VSARDLLSSPTGDPPDAAADPAARRRYRLCLLAIAVSLAIYSAIVIRDFSGPIGDHVESFLYEYLSYYVS
jgi:hypothetical protein